MICEALQDRGTHTFILLPPKTHGWLTADNRKSDCFNVSYQNDAAKSCLQAQSHAIKASKANSPTAAIDEHDLAAGQFATAANGVDDASEV